MEFMKQEFEEELRHLKRVHGLAMDTDRIIWSETGCMDWLWTRKE